MLLSIEFWLPRLIAGLLLGIIAVVIRPDDARAYATNYSVKVGITPDGVAQYGMHYDYGGTYQMARDFSASTGTAVNHRIYTNTSAVTGGNYKWKFTHLVCGVKVEAGYVNGSGAWVTWTGEVNIYLHLEPSNSPD